jgi:transcriptional regulator with XRE-family HTH domain
MRRFGEKLHALREQRGLTLMELATMLGYASYGRISEIENGKKTPSLAFVMRAAALFNVTPDQLLRDDIDLDASSDDPATSNEAA